ncbi:hypothetical protein [Saccharibacillus deserti]|uniref:hypothetical protein n=1 Tax=Saccharibacillus deserti TaxID=1634444 RepID=UPI001552E36F|nr:hypothetical protein [Saccharibacillus deserti]
MELHDLEMRDMIYGLAKAQNVSEMYKAWLLAPYSKDIKAIVCLEDYNKKVYPPDLARLMNSGELDIIPYFQSEQLYFLDVETTSDMFKSSTGQAVFALDYSIMLDTNYASYIHQFVNRKERSFDYPPFKKLGLLLEHNLNYDYFFYLIENTKGFSTDHFNLDEFKAKHSDIYKNMISMELFKSIDSKIFKTTGELQYGITVHEAVETTDEFVKSIFCSEIGREFYNEFRFVQKQMTLFLIGMLKINFRSGRNAAKKTTELFAYMHEVVGVYLDREMIIAHKFFDKEKGMDIFRKLQKNMEMENLQAIIENIAWDLTAPRVMEYFMARIGEGRYFLPFFLSNDEGLKNLFKLYNVKAVILDNDGHAISITDPVNVEYFEEKNCKVDFEYYFSDSSKRERFMKLEDNRKNINNLLRSEIAELSLFL